MGFIMVDQMADPKKFDKVLLGKINPYMVELEKILHKKLVIEYVYINNFMQELESIKIYIHSIDTHCASYYSISCNLVQMPGFCGTVVLVYYNNGFKKQEGLNIIAHKIIEEISLHLGYSRINLTCYKPNTKSFYSSYTEKTIKLRERFIKMLNDLNYKFVREIYNNRTSLTVLEYHKQITIK